MASLGSDERVFNMRELKGALLECTVCMESPCDSQALKLKLLNCHHTVCSECLNQLIDGRPSFSCPECRRPMAVPAEGVDGIPNNFIAAKIQEFANSCRPKRNVSAAASEIVKCGGCRDEIGRPEHRCVFCGYLCGTCTWQHRDNRALRHHTVFIPSKSPDGGKMDAKFCARHDYCRLDFFCRTCRVAVCKLCREFYHVDPSHSVGSISEVARDSLCEMEGLLEAVLKRQALVFKVFGRVRQEEERVRSEASNAKREVKAFIKECHTVLAKREMELVGSVDHRFQQLSKCLMFSKERAQDLHAKISSSLEYVDQIQRKREDPLSVIRAASALKPALLEIANAEIDADVVGDESFLSVNTGDLQFDVAAFKHLVSLLGKPFGDNFQDSSTPNAQ